MWLGNWLCDYCICFVDRILVLGFEPKNMVLSWDHCLDTWFWVLRLSSEFWSWDSGLIGEIYALRLGMGFVARLWKRRLGFNHVKIQEREIDPELGFESLDWNPAKSDQNWWEPRAPEDRSLVGKNLSFESRFDAWKDNLRHRGLIWSLWSLKSRFEAGRADFRYKELIWSLLG